MPAISLFHVQEVLLHPKRSACLLHFRDDPTEARETFSRTLSSGLPLSVMEGGLNRRKKWRAKTCRVEEGGEKMQSWMTLASPLQGLSISRNTNISELARSTCRGSSLDPLLQITVQRRYTQTHYYRVERARLDFSSLGPESSLASLSCHSILLCVPVCLTRGKTLERKITVRAPLR